MVKNAPAFFTTVNTPTKKVAIMKLRQQKQNEQNKKQIMIVNCKPHF